MLNILRELHNVSVTTAPICMPLTRYKCPLLHIFSSICFLELFNTKSDSQHLRSKCVLKVHVSDLYSSL